MGEEDSQPLKHRGCDEYATAWAGIKLRGWGGYGATWEGVPRMAQWPKHCAGTLQVVSLTLARVCLRGICFPLDHISDLCPMPRLRNSTQINILHVGLIDGYL